MNKIPCEPQMGADPELFVKDVNGRVVPCIGMVKGTKAKPFAPKGYELFGIQEDNVMCEFNVPPAQTDRAGRDAMNKARVMVAEQLAKKKLKAYWGRVSYAFKTASLTHKQATVFGCEADYDAYTGGIRRKPPEGMFDTNVRSCGGHIHLGGDFHCPDFVAALFAELFLGIGADGVWTPARKKERRKEWYGAPGIFRPKPYGIEYRTPDNMWITNDDTVQYVYQRGLACARYLTNKGADEIQRAFRAIPWTRQREYMEVGTPEDQEIILNFAREAGVPV